MKLFFARHSDLVISTAAAAVSGNLENFHDAYGLSILAPATLTSTTITVQVAQTTDATTFAALQSGGSDVTLAAAKALVITPVPFALLRLSGSSTEAASRSFSVSKVIAV